MFKDYIEFVIVGPSENKDNIVVYKAVPGVCYITGQWPHNYMLQDINISKEMYKLQITAK